MLTTKIIGVCLQTAPGSYAVEGYAICCSYKCTYDVIRKHKSLFKL